MKIKKGNIVHLKNEKEKLFVVVSNGSYYADGSLCVKLKCMDYLKFVIEHPKNLKLVKGRLCVD